MNITPETKLNELLKQWPGLADFLADYRPEFSKLRNPIMRKTIARIADIKTIADMGKVPVDQLIRDIKNAVEEGLPGFDPEKKEKLKSIILQLHQGADVEELKKRFKDLLEDVGPDQIAGLEQELIKEGLDPDDIKQLCDIHVALFQESLEKQEEQTDPDNPLSKMAARNRLIHSRAQQLLAKPDKTTLDALQDAVLPHYIRKENSLFPLLEAKGIDGPPKVMWGVHDDIRALFKQTESLLQTGNKEQIKEKVRELVEAVLSMVDKETKVLFPMALEILEPEDWERFRQHEDVKADYKHDTVRLGVGSLSPEQLDLMLRHLPVDISFVDENDTVLYYSATKDKIFPRTPGVIGRKVQNCHPPKSVHMVNRILQEFKAGRKDTADFWINMGPRFIYIRYIAVRDNNREYKGVLEITQDITEIQKLRGEKRLLDWE